MVTPKVNLGKVYQDIHALRVTSVAATMTVFGPLLSTIRIAFGHQSPLDGQKVRKLSDRSR